MSNPAYSAALFERLTERASIICKVKEEFDKAFQKRFNEMFAEKLAEIMYINDQEPWMGVYNPNLPKGDDVHGDGTWNNPFKTVERALLELKQRGEQRGSVRNMQSQLMAFQDYFGSFEDVRRKAMENAKEALNEAFNKYASNTDRGRVSQTEAPK